MPYIGTGRISLFFEEAGNDGIPLLLLHELGGSSESWREVIPLLATDRRVLAVDMRCAGRSEKPPGAFALAAVADDLDELLRALKLEGPVDVIGAALGSLAGALLAIRHPATVRRLMMCAVAPDMAGPTRAYLAERAEKVRVVGMRGVAEASLANSFPASTRRNGRPIAGFTWETTIDNINHADQGTGRKVHGPMTAELIFDDQAERIIQFKVFLEAPCGVNQKPASMRASPMPSRSSFAQAAVAADEAAPASFYGDTVLYVKDNIAVSSKHQKFGAAMMPPAPIEDLGRTDFREGRSCRLPSRCAARAGVLLRLSPRAKVLDLKERVRCRGCGARGRNAVSIKVAAADRVTRCRCAILDQLAAVIGSTLPADATVVSRSATRASASAWSPIWRE